VVLESRLKTKPNDPRTLAVLAQVDANLGNKELALQEAQKAAALMPVSKDAYDGPLIQQGLAQVYTWTGDHVTTHSMNCRLCSACRATFRMAT
jgi:cytochrome c-type biogenesis protein CcmH/NrfG